MGRGRAKAKQTKVARQLKYGGPQTDLERLEAELRGQTGHHPAEVSDDDEYEDDPYASYVDDDEDDDEDEDEER